MDFSVSNTLVSLEYDGSSASVEEDLPWLHHVVTESLADQEAPNGDVCVLNSSLGFPHRALQHGDLQTSTNAVYYRGFRQSSALGGH